MWFAVLGPLEVHDSGGKPLPVPPTRQRLLLAALLCSAGAPVSVDRLVDQIWHGDPPGTARANLQLYVHRLRRCLGADRIVHRADGYAIVVDPDELDAARFETLARDGRYEEALALWRGTPYAGLDELEVAREQSTRLEELRWHALAERVESQLARGEHSALVPELTALVAAHPLHERFRSQLMLALHRSGRAVDALTVFQDGRRALVDELGIEPGTALQDLHARILDDDPGLVPDDAVASPLVPAEVPAPTATFTGREADVRRIAALLRTDGRTPVVAITGIGGVGKSALGVQTAHEVADRFPDGQLYVNLQGATPGATPLTPEEVLGRFLRSLGVADSAVPSRLHEAASRFRSLTAERTLLVVLDDAADAAQVRPLLPGGKACAVLVTSRQILTEVEGAVNLGLTALGPGESATLVARQCGDDRLAAEPAATAELVELCGGLPLALCLAGARLARRPQWPVSALVGRLRDSQRRLDELQSGDRAVRTSFGVSHEDLRAAAARVFACLALVDVADVGTATAAAAADLPEHVAEELLEELVDAQLLESPTVGRFRMHDLIRLFARERATEELARDERTAVVHRAAHHYLATAYQVADFQSPGHWRNGLAPASLREGGSPMRSDADVTAWLVAERQNLRDVAREIAASDSDGPAACALFANLLFASLNTRGQWYEIRSLNGFVLDATAADSEHLGDARALAHNDLGWAYAVLGRGDDAVAHLTEALEHWERTGHASGEAHSRRSLVKALTVTGRPQEARDQATRALALFRDLGARTGEIDCLIAIGLIHAHEDRLGDAIETHEKALAIATEVDDEWHRGAVLGNLGDLYRRDGQPARARAHFEDALTVDRVVGNDGTYYEAEHLWGLGSTLHELGDAHAHACWDRAAWILRDLGLVGAEEYDAIVSVAVPPLPEVIAQQL
ncbi:BTAD domain-containing putative transcriptional regulator [Mumia sp. DW29H23]|uniref:AfsR/SARP family transcriptional regulator n=1 Tax=Mumia sp. DW29H23 TaxID=3421241 RepID=UPI003D692F93